ncbi:putative membrane protein [Synechococcus sp. SYN20]|nr:putative membrane protein [Synechococcus sp. SYN20]
MTFVIHGVNQCAVVLVAVDLVAVLFLLSPNVKPVMSSDGHL